MKFLRCRCTEVYWNKDFFNTCKHSYPATAANLEMAKDYNQVCCLKRSVKVITKKKTGHQTCLQGRMDELYARLTDGTSWRIWTGPGWVSLCSGSRRKPYRKGRTVWLPKKKNSDTYWWSLIVQRQNAVACRGMVKRTWLKLWCFWPADCVFVFYATTWIGFTLVFWGTGFSLFILIGLRLGLCWAPPTAGKKHYFKNWRMVGGSYFLH